MGQASPRCRSSGDEKMKQSLPHVAGGSADTIEPAVSSFLQPPMTSCRPHPAGAVQVSGAVQPPTEKPCLDPGSLAGPGSLMPSDGKRPSHHPALPADRSSRPRSVRGDGKTMRAISVRGIRWIDSLDASPTTLSSNCHKLTTRSKFHSFIPPPSFHRHLSAARACARHGASRRARRPNLRERGAPGPVQPMNASGRQQ